MSKSVLYYCPYAGASSITLNNWKNVFEPEIKFIPIDYAGHGKRRSEKFYLSVKEACYDIYSKIKGDIQNYDYFYLGGHCIGAIIAYEMYYLIKEKNDIYLPDAIFISGQGAPSLQKSLYLNNMDDHQLLRYLYDNSAINAEMLNKELFDYVENLVLAPVRADSKMSDDYIFETKRELVESNIYVWYGNNDEVFTSEDMKEWSKLAKKPIEYQRMEGGHFFIINNYEKYIQQIKHCIAEYEMNNTSNWYR